MSLNVSLTPELEKRIRQHVDSGLYSSASEVIREALRFFEAYQDAQAASFVALRKEIAKGVADVESGNVGVVSFAELKQRGRAMLAARESN